MSDDDPNWRNIPTTTIHHAYEQCLQARRDYIRGVHVSGADDATIDAMHQDLHGKVMTYYESLRPFLAKSANVSDYWEDKKLWETTQPKRDEQGELMQTDGGQLAYERVDVCGLQTLEDWFGRTQPVTTTVDGFMGERVIQTVEPERLSVTALFRVARYLDEVADELDLLAPTPQEIDGEEVTDEDLQEMYETGVIS